MVQIIKIDKQDYHEALRRAKEVVLGDGVLIYPTDTIYGIGGNAFSEKVVNRIREIKGSPEEKSYSVIMSDINMIKRYCEVDAWQLKVLKAHLPGPFTFLLKAKVKMPVSANQKLGVRIPDYAFAHQLAELCDMPIVTTSANPSGKKPACRLEETTGKILSAVDLAIDDGVTKFQEASAIVDLVEKKVLRKGVWEIELFGY
jgi:L-threonylcarbamoyladenylate synthase